MATYRQKANAEKFAGSVRALVAQSKALRANITALTNFWNGLSGAQQSGLNTLLNNLGFDATEISTIRGKLSDVGTAIDAITESVDPSF